MQEKQCSICENYFKATNEHFYKNKSSKDGLFPYCKTCTIKKNSKWQQSISRERKREYYKKCDSSPRRKKIKRDYSKKQKEIGYYKEWQEQNRDKIYDYQLERSMNKDHDISDTEWFECLDFFNNSCAYCGITEGEAYKLFGQLLHKEHVEHYGVNDITNCVPSCKGCNSQKWEFELNEWYNEENPVYSKRRYNKIIEWLLSFSEEKITMN
ncbi:HNH endonuclease [Siminovitchia sp. 179-K 8D1 HS]|uniref:HNH endonuclease n=1 Tax=Siminovitchia sp. 179-K 8D1 HS TaxID=3142385 RepID=UPI0039A35F43